VYTYKYTRIIQQREFGSLNTTEVTNYRVLISSVAQPHTCACTHARTQCWLRVFEISLNILEMCYLKEISNKGTIRDYSLGFWQAQIMLLLMMKVFNVIL